MTNGPGWLLPKPPPTTQMSEGEMIAMPNSSALCPPGSRGVGTTLHCFPSKCSTKGLCLWNISSTNEPTAKMSSAEMACTALRASPDLKCGLGTTVQRVPSKCWISEKTKFDCSPTAQTSVGDKTATPSIRLAFAMETALHLFPSKCSEIGCVLFGTAQMSSSELAEIAPTA